MTKLIILNSYQTNLTIFTDSLATLLERLSQETVFVTGKERYEYIEDWLSSESSPSFLLIDDSEVVGIFATDWECCREGELWIDLIALDRKYRNQGYGQILVSKAIDYIRDNTEYTQLTLSVASDNHRAINVYNKFGFNSDCKISMSYKKMTLLVNNRRTK